MTADKNCAHRQELTSWIHFIAFHKAISVATLLLLLVSLPSGQSSYHANEGGKSLKTMFVTVYEIQMLSGTLI